MLRLTWVGAGDLDDLGGCVGFGVGGYGSLEYAGSRVSE